MSQLPHLLLVEDDAELAALLASALETELRVTACRSGEQALGLLGGAEHFDIAFIDMNLPGISGVCVASEIRHRCPGTRVVLTSGSPDTTDLAQALNVHVDGFVPKPYQPTQVVDQVIRLLEKKDTPEQLLKEITSLKERANEDTRALARIRRAALLALAKLAESRDTDTGAHVERVGLFCSDIARRLSIAGPYRNQIDAEFVANIRHAAPLHDIGKVGIPDAILLKPARLTPEEFDNMKKHTVIGAHVLDSAIAALERPDPVLVMARDIVRHHHERWDGKGYPDGLKGDEIPLAARIVAVVDNYDALRSKRVYKPAFTRRETQVILKTASDAGQFDPVIVEALQMCEPRFEKIGGLDGEDDTASDPETARYKEPVAS
jgi:putative two-component system response regulator